MELYALLKNICKTLDTQKELIGLLTERITLLEERIAIMTELDEGGMGK